MTTATTNDFDGPSTDASAAALRAALRPRRFGALYVLEHRLRAARQAWTSFVFPALGTPVLYLFAMGLGLGSLIRQGSGSVDGVSYLVFVAPALLTAAAFQTASEEFIFPIRVGFKWNPIFFGMNAAPLSPGQIIDGNVLATSVRVVLNGLVYFALMALFGAVPSGWGVLSVLAALLTALSFGGPLCAYIASLDKEASQETLVLRFVVMPLTLFSGTYFPLALMPVYLQWIGWISPLWHGTQLARDLTYGAGEPGWLVAVHLAYLVATFVVGWQLARRIAGKRLNK
ncbi:ABC transporter permease [Gryllotalpicola ginsengisoli]|uniref:ABC transporter permease n=1 Tax=Gryllotalpicola ginsengisoli TaxID=444608 RepID=UPI0003B3136A|nr:ABC transporter permease [Gryllotalpicola ginsengisoli]